MSIESKTFANVEEITSLADTDFLLIHDGNNVKIIEKSNLGGADSGFSVESNAGAHNSIFRGKNLGSSVTAEQWASIGAGTFDDLFIGDYWTINNINYRIAAFDYYLHCNGTEIVDHHVTIVPDQQLDSKRMEASNITTNGYAGSEMYKTNLATAKTTIQSAFGSDHLLTVKEYFQNASASGSPSGYSEYSSIVDLMGEIEVYGARYYSQSSKGTLYNNYTYSKTQFPLFYLAPRFIVCRNTSGSRVTWWLRDIVSATNFALVDYGGYAGGSGASAAYGVRPRFSIKA